MIVLQCNPLGLFPYVLLAASDTLANTVQPKVKITAQLKNFSSEATCKIPF